MAHAQIDAVDGVTGVIGLFERVPLVALGEMHGVEQGARFVEALVRHPGFARAANSVVVEFGNALFQDVVDDYIAGGHVDRRKLRRVWEDFIGAAPWGFRDPIYEQFFATVRTVNQSLPSERRIRVLLGDPPFDWNTVHSFEPIASALGARDSHFADVVEREVLEHGQRALLLAGAFHLVRTPPFGPPRTARAPRMLMQTLDANHPGTTFVVLPHNIAALDTRLAPWPIPGFAHIRGTWLGELFAENVFGSVDVKMETPDGVVATPYAGTSWTLQDLADGYLYLGPTAGFSRSRFDPAMLDAEDRAELDRRIALMRPIRER